MVRHFLERRRVTNLLCGPDGRPSLTTEEHCGHGWTDVADGVWRHASRPVRAGEVPGNLPETLAQPGLRLFEVEVGSGTSRTPEVEAAASLVQTLTRSVAHGVALGVVARHESREVLCGTGERARGDGQHFVRVELKATVMDGSSRAELQREHAFDSWQGFVDAGPRLLEEVDGLQALVRERLHAVAPPSGALTVVFPPGADAAVFFHEVCGHPLEADVVSRRCSYLGPRIGQPIASEQVSVFDDPLAQSAGVRYRMDDEGVAAATVPLIDRGVVRGPLLDEVTADRLHVVANGHGRRTSYRFPALPRMAHTELRANEQAGAGTFHEIVGEVEDGLLVRFLTPRHVDILRGTFSFYVVEAQRIDRGRVGAFVGPAILHGDGLRALGDIDAVGSDLKTFFGLKGCGKLDHGPLPVSFANPTVRFRKLEVTPWR